MPGNDISLTDNLSPILLTDIRTLIEESRRRVAQNVNAELTQLYWQIGSRICEDILGQERADYGKQIIEKLSISLTSEFGRGFNRLSLYRMLRFSECFPNIAIVSTMWKQLSWSHLRIIITIDDTLKRWSVRVLLV